MRPAREAQILRQLVSWRQGTVPVSLLVRLWRSIIASATSLQAKVVIHVGKEIAQDHGLRDLVRDHFPGLSLSVDADEAQTVSRLADSPFDIGAVRAEGDWIAPLLKARSHGVEVMGVLPVLAPHDRPPQLVILGHAAAEPSGEDQTLIAFKGEGETGCKEAIWQLQAGAYRCVALAGFIEEARVGRDALKPVVLGRCPLPIGAGE
jgi:hypothetical protein